MPYLLAAVLFLALSGAAVVVVWRADVQARRDRDRSRTTVTARSPR